MELEIFFFLSFVLLIIGSLPLWWKALGRIRSGGAVIELRETSECPFGFVDVGLMFLFWLFGQLACIGVAVLLLGINPSKLTELSGSKMAWLTVIVSAGQLVATAGALLLLHLRYRKFEVFGLSGPTIGRDIALGALAFVMVVPTILLMQMGLTQWVDYEHETLEMLSKNADALTIGASWFAAVLVAPISEEIFFRGVLQAWFQRMFGGGQLFSEGKVFGGWDKTPNRQEDVIESVMGSETGNPYSAPLGANFLLGNRPPASPLWAILISSGMFAMAHLGQGPAPIPLFVFGMALGYVYYKTGSVIPCIVLHMLLNGFSMFWFTLGTIFPDPEDQELVPSEIDVAPAMLQISDCLEQIFMAMGFH